MSIAPQQSTSVSQAPTPASPDIPWWKTPAVILTVCISLVLPALTTYVSQSVAWASLTQSVAANTAKIKEWEPAKEQSVTERAVIKEQISDMRQDVSGLKDDVKEMRGDIKLLLQRGAK